MDNYEMLSEADARGSALFKRVRDGKMAQVKVAWLKPAPRGEGVYWVPRSRTKAVRLDGLDWDSLKG